MVTLSVTSTTAAATPDSGAINQLLAQLGALTTTNVNDARVQKYVFEQMGLDTAGQKTVMAATVRYVNLVKALRQQHLQVVSAPLSRPAKDQQIREVYQQRSALIVQAYTQLVADLGPSKAALLDAYLLRRSRTVPVPGAK